MSGLQVERPSRIPVLPLAIPQGGTGATDAADARANLGLGALAVQDTVSQAQVDNLPGDLTTLAAAITARLIAANNLSDLADAATARANLGLTIGTHVQAYDADLAAIAGLTSAADRVPYFTGAATAALATLTSYARTLLDDADATTARATLGLTIGTDVQAFDAELAALAGLTSAADRLPYYTGLGTAALATFTAAGRALVDDADAAAQRTTLGVGTTQSPTFAGLTVDSPTLVVDATNNRVGIGTASPAVTSHVAVVTAAGAVEVLRLDIFGNAAAARGPILTFYGPNNSGTSRLVAAIQGVNDLAGLATGRLTFHTEDNANVLQERTRIDSAGRWGLGTTLGASGVTYQAGNIAGTLQLVGTSSVQEREMMTLAPAWATSTDASRKARAVLSVYDTAAREVLRGEASGSAPMIGVLGAAAAARQTLNAASTDLATVVALCNQIRAALILFGWCV